MMLLWFRKWEPRFSSQYMVVRLVLLQNKLLVLRHNSYINVNKRLSTTRWTTMSFWRFSEVIS